MGGSAERQSEKGFEGGDLDIGDIDGVQNGLLWGRG